LVSRYPDVADYQEYLAACCGNLGELYQDQHRYAEAERLFVKNKATLEGLARSYPSVPAYRSRLALTESSLENIFEKTGRLPEAEAAARRWIELRQVLVKQMPTAVHHRDMLALGERTLADLLVERRDYAHARDAREESIHQTLEALKISAGDPKRVLALREQYADFVAILLRVGDHQAAAKAAFEFLDAVPPDAAARRRAAALLASCVPAARGDTHLMPARRQRLSQQYAAQAVEQLQLAVQAGFKDGDSLAKDKSLDVLRSREDYKNVERAVVGASGGTAR
jgi:tetratricopeptide (TPR) repeat protein